MPERSFFPDLTRHVECDWTRAFFARRLRCVSAAVCCFALGFGAAAVSAADVTVAYDPVDNGPNIAAAIAAAGPGGTVTVPNNGNVWYVRDGRKFNSAIVLDQPNQRFRLAAGVRLQASPDPNAFPELTDRFISVAADGVRIIGMGFGATIGGNRGLYTIEDPFDNHGRQAIRVGGFANVTIRNLSILDAGGDGIQIGGYYVDNEPSNLLIEDCYIEGSTRNGISLTSGDRVRIRRCRLVDSGGVWPQAGIDVEIDKDRPSSVLKDVLIEDVSAESCAGAGLMVGLFNYFDDDVPPRVGDAQDVELRFVRCESLWCGQWGIKLSAARQEELSGSPQGVIEFEDTYVTGSASHGVQINGFISGVTPSLLFRGLTLDNVATGAGFESPQYPIWFKGPRRGYRLGGVRFEASANEPCLVVDNVDRPIITGEPGTLNGNPTNGKGFRDITGQIVVDSPSNVFFELGSPEYHENVSVERIGSAASLIGNGGFENGLEGWRLWQDIVSIVGNAYSGQQAARLASGPGGLRTDPAATIAGESFRFSAAVRTNNDQQKVQVGVRWLAADGSLISRDRFFPPATGWQLVESNVVAPSGAESVQVYAYRNDGATGAALVDDFQLEPID